ncbi:alanine--tRNA ligase [Thiospirochaeta perfilievii]|uniref:Alanine--tRNA ligase n=1 Tax=Thiospirochaeta perfilievii TaxID=252967 RepID=A0A5C1Q7Z1_9SPIO|nr:alanine--tRNA ligase [Thiospirochaeta perfilievii]QEN03160.1 alanine--tRNA ligase [Thiospirochaeta perfilievii]
MKADDLRKKYIDFFVSNNHKEISGKSLLPENDPTVLFTTAGMHPLVPYILGEVHPAGKRLTNVQKCIRTGDIDDVGDATHLTFFEMLGNWSLGDYFKKEAINMSFNFLKDVIGIDINKLSVTVFEGDNDAPCDNDSIGYWKELGLPDSRIYKLPKGDNWWGPAGQTGPCGPDTEMFIDTGKEVCSPECIPGCGCGKYFEIWNNVFMQYDKQEDGSFKPLAMPCVDTGMGVERTITMLQGKKSVYQTELFIPLIEKIEELSGAKYGESEDTDMSIRIICDHIRTSTFIIGDEKGVQPSNVGQGYILRRLLRRAIRHGKKLGLEEKFISKPADIVIDMYKDQYPELNEKREFIFSVLEAEEDKFGLTLKKGEQEFSKLLPNLKKNPKLIIPGRVAFTLFDTYGFPLELTEELAKEEGMTVDRDGFDKAFEKHKELSKQGADKIFKGGMADDSVMSTKYHTATHLLHKALKIVLGDHVNQKGSNITSERLRFDFSHPDKMTKEEIQEVEALVNKAIEDKLPITMQTMTVEEAKDLGAMALFSSKYGEQVKVYKMGDFSLEVCGGPHIENTGDLGVFKIKKEQSSSAGVRRIKAVLL